MIRTRLTLEGSSLFLNVVAFVKTGNKKKKFSKIERLKQLQEEEEKRLKEEEEARVKSEKEELARLEIEQIEKEKWQQLEAKWMHYIHCDGCPDPSVAQEINTFISLWKEEKNETFEEVIAKSKLVLYLIDRLKLILLETPSHDLQEKSIMQYQGSIVELRELLHLKFNIATELLLRQASTLADLDTGNMEKVIQDENITLYVWANLKKNPRHRSIKCNEMQIGFEIPRILASSDIALRLLHTRYDHVTPLCPVPIVLNSHTPLESPSVQDEVCAEQPAISKELQEEYKQPENESNLVQEEETKSEEQDDDTLGVHTSSVLRAISAMCRESASLSREILGTLCSAVLHPVVTCLAPFHPTAASGTVCSCIPFGTRPRLKATSAAGLPGHWDHQLIPGCSGAQACGKAGPGDFTSKHLCRPPMEHAACSGRSCGRPPLLLLEALMEAAGHAATYLPRHEQP
ncbi:Cancer susceptibility candidate protein 1 like protein [Myotis davidii]|uniref:Dynein axonemal intermediate chain 7 n=1 Tax=Myotis davidii TaxID=225400 RepID=L5LFN5_MYODS|nr:Cancer susceptibility candidate protein 1 like protein [Myotis davidii]